MNWGGFVWIFTGAEVPQQNEPAEVRIKYLILFDFSAQTGHSWGCQLLLGCQGRVGRKVPGSKELQGDAPVALPLWGQLGWRIQEEENKKPKLNQLHLAQNKGTF